MLVLTRKREQRIRIGDDILVEIIRTGRNTVKIGIQAPDDMRVMRDELLEELDTADLGALARLATSRPISVTAPCSTRKLATRCR